ncbi:GGDEF domain-containing protein [Colwellia sp. E150_009]
MKLSLLHQILFFTLGSCLLFTILVFSILWSIQAVDITLKREKYAHKVEDRTNILKQFILSEDIYSSNYNTNNWLTLENKFDNLLQLAPNLTPQQQTIQNSIVSQNKSVQRLFNAINENKLKNANQAIKKHLKIRLITQLEAIRTDSIQLSTIANEDIQSVIKNQIIFVLLVLILIILALVYGAFRLTTVFKTSLNEVKKAFKDNHSGNFQNIHFSNHTEEFESIANAFNAMNKKLSVTTVSLESMKKIVHERTCKLEQLSNTDPLTQVANRRALFERGNAEFSRIQRSKNELTIILLDCDLFKDINDEFGHVFGDKVLKHLSEICTKEIRNIDFFARYGGEEFIIILPDSDLNGAIETAKRIQQSLTDQRLKFEDKDVPLTVSMGISTVTSKHENFEQLIKDADIAMYKAKTNGRNRIEIADETNTIIKKA